MRPVSCSSCGVSACSQCISDWKWRDTKCPAGCSKFTYGKPSQFLTNWLSKLKLKCENAANGCTETLNHDDAEAHQINCQYSKKACKNTGCNVKGTIIDIKAHESECEFAQKHCGSCNELLTKQSESTHFCIQTLSERLSKMEMIIQKLTKSNSKNIDSGSKVVSGAIYRYINPSEYQIHVMPYQQQVATYQFPAPHSEAGGTIDARALLLRIKISNSGIAQLISKFSISQAGNQ